MSSHKMPEPKQTNVTRISEQRRGSDDIVHSMKVALNDATVLFKDRMITFDGRHAIVIGYDRNVDALICAEILPDATLQLVIVDTADLSDIDINYPDANVQIDIFNTWQKFQTVSLDDCAENWSKQ